LYVIKDEILIDNLFLNLNDKQCVPACTFKCDVFDYNYIPSPHMSDDIAVDVCVNKFIDGGINLSFDADYLYCHEILLILTVIIQFNIYILVYLILFQKLLL
jgi:hypothetical protein